MSLETLVEQYGTNRVVQAVDDPLSSLIGFAGSLPAKLMFLDRDMGAYPQKEVADHVRGYVKSSGLENTTVRLGHSRVIQDTYRLFTDDRLKDIPWISRATLGLFYTVTWGLMGKLTRSDYYNPFTRTAHIYSNVKAIATHELGHAKDYQDKKYVTAYTLSRMFLPITLYQEFMASKHAHRSLPKEEKWQTARYLVPGFFSYMLSPLWGFIAADASEIKNRVVPPKKRKKPHSTSSWNPWKVLNLVPA